MSTGPTSRLYRAGARSEDRGGGGGRADLPGSKYASLFLFYAIPTPGHTAPELRTTRSIARSSGSRTSRSPTMSCGWSRRAPKVNLLRGLENNQGLAIAFAKAQQRYGDWRQVFRNVQEIEKRSPG